ncbi:hypothetical protein [Dietzia sp.]|uniref:hypothetical protein n=1 Tax=Dietzia sp. TaxID=1871616 RepID=UPI002FDB735E
MSSVPEIVDSVELWLSTLPFAPQVAIVVAVLLPVSIGLAKLIGSATDAVLSPAVVDRVRGRDEAAEEELG